MSDTGEDQGRPCLCEVNGSAEYVMRLWWSMEDAQDWCFGGVIQGRTFLAYLPKVGVTNPWEVASLKIKEAMTRWGSEPPPLKPEMLEALEKWRSEHPEHPPGGCFLYES